MEDLIKNIKKKLSTDNLVEMMKDAKVIDNKRIKEEDIRKTLEKIDPNNLIDVDELAAKLTEITEEAASKDPKVNKPKESKSGVFTVLSKNTTRSDMADDDEDFVIKDNITGFLD